VTQKSPSYLDDVRREEVWTGKTHSDAEFDGYSQTYEQLVNKSVWVTGESVEYFADLKARYLARSVGHEFCGKILDFGCGVGLLSRVLLSYLPSCALHGYDVSSASVELVPAEVSARGKFTSLEQELDTDYELIIVANVMHHVPGPDRQKLILGLGKRLGKKGRLAIFEHNPLNPLTRWAVKQCPFDVGVKLLWPSEVRHYCEVAGLKRKTQDYLTFFPRAVAWLRRFEPTLAWCPLGGQYVLMAQKSERGLGKTVAQDEGGSAVQNS